MHNVSIKTKAHTVLRKVIHSFSRSFSSDSSSGEYVRMKKIEVLLAYIEEYLIMIFK